MNSLSLRHNVFWTMAGNTIYAGFQWGMLAVLAKLTNPQMVGQFGLGLAITAPVFMFANFHLRYVQATDARSEYWFGEYLGLRLITTSLALLVIAAITAMTEFSTTTKVIILAVGASKAIGAFQDIIYGLLQKHERMDRMGLSLIITGPVELTFLGIIVFLTGNVFWGVLGMTFASVLVFISYDLRSAILILRSSPEELHVAGPLAGVSSFRLLKPHWSLSRLWPLAWLSLPLAFVVTLNSLNVNIPRYFIANYLGEYELGLFVAIAYVMVGGNMVVRALGISISPKLAKHYAAGRGAAYRRLLWKSTFGVAMLGLLGVALTVVAGKKILTILYRPEYAQHTDVFILLMVGGAVVYLATFLRHALTAARFFKVQLPLYILFNLTSIVACYFLIPRYGLMGAAWANLMAALVILLGIGLTLIFVLQSQGRRLADQKLRVPEGSTQ